MQIITVHSLLAPRFQFLVGRVRNIRTIFSAGKRQRFLLINTSFFVLIRIIFNRFIGDDLHKAQVPIRVIDDKGLSGVKFFKTPKFEKGTLLCRLNFRVSPLKRKLKVRGLFCNFLSTICHCLFDCCTVFERVFHTIPFCSTTVLRMTVAKFRSTVR